MHKALWLVILSWAVLGPSPVLAKMVMPFSGEIDLDKGRLDVSLGAPEAPVAKIEIVRAAPRKYRMTADLAHLKTPLCDVATLLSGTLEFVGEAPQAMGIVGEVSSQYTLLDYKPVRDLYLKFALKDRQIEILSFWAGAFSGHGRMDLVGDRNIDFALELLSLDLGSVEDFLQTKIDMKSFGLTGVATGAVNLRGSLARPHLSGRVVLYNGHLQAFAYESIVLNFAGDVPILRFDDVLVTNQEGMSFRAHGVIDLEDLPRLKEQVGLFQSQPIISQDGDRPEWVFKRLSLDGDAKTEMKYFLMKDDRGDASAVLGVQKSIGF